MFGCSILVEMICIVRSHDGVRNGENSSKGEL